jgi:adenylate cyclase
MHSEPIERKLAAIVAADIVGFSRLAGVDEDRILARLRTLRSDLIDPTIAVHRGRVVKRTGDGFIAEFRSVVDAVNCAIEVQNGMAERNEGVASARRIDFRIGVHLGDVVEESDGDLMGDGVNIAARLEGIGAPGKICLSEDAYRQVRSRLTLAVSDLGEKELKNIPVPVRAYLLTPGKAPKVHTLASAPRKKPLAAVAQGAALVLVIVAASWYFESGPRPATPGAPRTTALLTEPQPVTLASTEQEPAPSKPTLAPAPPHKVRPTTA